MPSSSDCPNQPAIKKQSEGTNALFSIAASTFINLQYPWVLAPPLILSSCISKSFQVQDMYNDEIAISKYPTGALIYKSETK
jgi:hypothetical protein